MSFTSETYDQLFFRVLAWEAARNGSVAAGLFPKSNMEEGGVDGASRTKRFLLTGGMHNEMEIE